MSAIYNLLLNACQAATLSTRVPEVKVHATEVDEQICVTISDNGPGTYVELRLIVKFGSSVRPLAQSKR
jgi:C4-dicarboxylate-specific signal transduction histidine kinase